VDVAVEPTAFEQAQSGAITGPIWLQHEGIDFPERGWRDFPVVVLGWWLQHLADLAGGAKSALCSFMDGPYEFIVRNDAPGQLCLQLSERGAEETFVISQVTVDALHLQASVLAAATSALAECDHRGWSGSDVEGLRQLVNLSRH
jgi:hypothetical protein